MSSNSNSGIRASRSIALGLISGSLLLSALLALSQAQVVLDGTTGGREGQVVGPGITPDGRPTDHLITRQLGTLKGNNLFHSFREFSIATGKGATFTGPSSVRNIISRVTGGKVSSIDGFLESTIAGADLFFINPSGVIFGPNAQLFVSGSFHVSTADELRFADGYAFRAVNRPEPLLTVASPTAFGFLGPQPPAPLTIRGSSLRVPDGQTLSMVGGPIEIVRDPDTSSSPELLALAGGRLQIASVAASGDVVLQSPEQTPVFEVDRSQRLGQVDITEALIATSGDTGGTVVIQGGRLRVDNSAILADTLGNKDGTGRGIHLAMTESVNVTNNSLIRAASLGKGQGGDVTIESARVILDASTIDSSKSSSGPAGTIRITAKESMTISNRSLVSSLASRTATGAAGRIVLSTPQLVIEHGIIITDTVGEAAAGDVKVDVQTLELRDGAFFDSSSTRQGHGGTITVTATESISMSGASGLFAFSFGGDAGNVTLSAHRLHMEDTAFITNLTTREARGGVIKVNVSTLTIRDAAAISGSTSGSQVAGAVIITATKAIDIAGNERSGIRSNASPGTSPPLGDAGQIALSAPDITIGGKSQIATITQGKGSGGDITVEADRHLRVQERAVINSSTTATGNAGEIVLAAPLVTLEDQGRIQATTERTGRGGSIVVKAGRVTLSGGAQIDSSSEGNGRGGRIHLTATDMVTLSGAKSGIFTTSAGRRRGGDITLQARTVQLTDGAVVAAESTGAGNAGSVTISATDTLLSNHSFITTAAETAGGGNIAVEARVVRLTDSALTAEARGVEQRGSDGGNVTIRAGFVILEGSQVQANAFGGNGGMITIAAEDAFLADTETCADQACLNASSDLGVAGTVEVSTPTADLSGVVTPLPQSFTQATALLPQRCAERLQGQPVSTFVLAGRDSLPAQPGGVLPSPLGAEGSERTQRRPDQARGHGGPGIRPGQLGMDAHGRPRVQGWSVRSMASLAWEAGCPQGQREEEASRTYPR